MTNFIEWLMDYINTKLSEDKDFTDKFTINFSYDMEEEPVTPQISFMELNDIDYDRATTFNKINSSTIGIQIEIFTQQMIILNNDFDDDIATEQQSAMLISNKIKEIVRNLYETRDNSNILRQRKVGSTFPTPFSTGIYRAVNRFEFIINNK